MTFKEQLTADRDIFMNPDEFGETHNVNGVSMNIIIDDLEQVDREKRYKFKHSLYADGVSLKEVLFYVKAEDFGACPAVGRSITLDGKTYIVTEAINEDKIYSISMQRNVT